jgi:hypothetical protein
LGTVFIESLGDVLSEGTDLLVALTTRLGPKDVTGPEDDQFGQHHSLVWPLNVEMMALIVVAITNPPTARAAGLAIP